MAEKPKEHFAPIPARAIGDKRLTAEDFRVLGVVACHDRFGANGIGCYAGHPRLARLAECHETSLSRTLRRLGDFGYLQAGLHPLNKRLRVYRVIYGDFDASYIKSIDSKPAKNEGTFQPVGAIPIVSNPANETGPIVNKPNPEPQSFQQDSSVNILGETRIYPAEAGKISRELAPREKNPKSVGAILAMIERSMKASPSNLKAIAKQWLPWIEDVVLSDADGVGDDNYGRAYRLGEELSAFVD